MENYRHISFLLLMLMNFLALNGKTQTATCDVDVNTIINTDTKRLMGITFDARSGMDGNTGPVGYYDSQGNYRPGIDVVFDDFPIFGMRYPGNAIAMGFNWKNSIGNNRPNVNILAAVGPSQIMNFGFDEYMEMAISKGVNPADIQIMITIYDSAITYANNYINSQRIPFPAQNAADWVEYCNAPNDGSNWGGGEDWALRRSQNGRDLPYGIKIWNIGNEPWTTNEFNFDPTNYLTTITPIIDSMLARDPSIHITLPTVGAHNNVWNTGIFNFANSHGGIYGISQHYFMTEDVDTITSTILKGVLRADNNLNQLATTAASHNLKVIVGDYAHEIKTNPSTIDKNLAMQWKGANLTTDFILMMSQVNNVERANFWVYGNVFATWRAIRMESPGIYTSLPQAELHKLISDLVLDQSLSTVSSSPVASDGNNYSVRSGSFSSYDLNKINVLSLNRDKSVSHTLQINGMNNYQLKKATIYTADTLDSEIINSYCVNADANGNFLIPAFSFFVAEFENTVSTIDACKSYSIGNNTYLLDGIYLDTLQNVMGCDSIIKTNLTIHQIDNTVTVSNNIITSNETNATYSWIDCFDNSIIQGMNKISFTPSSNGIYAVIVSDNFCTDTSNCQTISTLSIENNDQSELQFYPNPASNVIHFSKEISEYTILNYLGEFVLENKNVYTNQIDLFYLPNGIYFLKIQNQILKLVINK